ncbi:hypothetical protein [Actinoplanes sp. G11-F43]|uniref:hypothetical protein n=1 Tax=Actinoplanes sp. G11-F43 TaxID=3424130 RepID=UPI003D354D56
MELAASVELATLTELTTLPELATMLEFPALVELSVLAGTLLVRTCLVSGVLLGPGLAVREARGGGRRHRSTVLAGRNLPTVLRTPGPVLIAAHRTAGSTV